MKTKKGMRAISLLLVMALLGAIIVPAVSAETNPQPIKLNDSFQLVENIQPPLFDWSGIEPNSPMTESELTTIVVSAAYGARQTGSESPEIIEISLPVSAFGKKESITNSIPDLLIQEGITEGEAVLVLTIPDTMFRAFNTDPNYVEMSFPAEYFTLYTDIDSFYDDRNSQKTSSESYNKKNYDQITEFDLTGKYSERGGQQYLSRVRYTANSGYEITYLTGKIKPNYYTNSGNGYTIFQEKEINFNRLDYQGEPLDTIEIVVEYEDTNHGGGIKLYPILYDDTSSAINMGPDSYIDVSRPSIPHEYNFYVSLGSGSTLGEYEVWLQDTTSEEWLGYYYYNDDDDPSRFINRTIGSSELLLWDDSTFSFDARTSPITDEWCKEGSTWHDPASAFRYFERQYDSYVSTSHSTGSGKIYTHAYCSGSGSS